jgi:hypothetical protein
MIRRVRGELVAECDDCGAEYAGGVQDDFRAFVDEIKDAGWQIYKDGDDWCHRCPECQQ